MRWEARERAGGIEPALAQQFNDARHEPRRALELIAHLRTAQGGKVAARLVNISCAGFCVQLDAWLPQGTYVVLTLPSFEPLCGTVVWAEPGLAGCRFSEPLHAGVVALLAERSLS